MDYRLVDKPAFKVVGKTVRVTLKNGEHLIRIPQFWDECVHDGSLDKLMGLASTGQLLGKVTLGVIMDFSENMEQFTYMIAAVQPDGAVPEGMIVETIPAATWAVFEAIGPMPEAIQNLWSRIMSEFFSTAQFEHAKAPGLELYPNNGSPDEPDYRSEVWVPVIRK